MEDRFLFKAKHFEEWYIGNIVKEPDGLYIRDIKENVMAYMQSDGTAVLRRLEKIADKLKGGGSGE